jgi:hypothetical protein
MNFGTTIVAEALPVSSDIYETNYRCEGYRGDGSGATRTKALADLAEARPGHLSTLAVQICPSSR